jgi:tetratricopeptide (TPR) repeat protein
MKIDSFLKQGLDFHYKQKSIYRAILAYRAAIRRNPKLSFAFLERGCCFFEMGSYDESIADFDTVLSLNTNNILAYNYAYRLREWVIYFKTWAKCHKNHIDILKLVNNAIDYKVDEYVKAIEIFDKAINLCPDNAYAFYNLGRLYDEVGEGKMAEKNYTEAIKYAPVVSDVYDSRGFYYLQQKLYDKAIADYTMAIQIYPNHTSAIFCCGEAFYAQEKYSIALEMFKIVLEINPDDERAKINIQKIIDNEKGHKNSTELHQMPQYTLINDIVNLRLDFIKNEEKRIQVEIEKRKSVEILKNQVAHDLLECLDFLLNKDFDNAISKSTKIIDVDPSDSRSYACRSVGYRETGQFELALKDLKKVKKLDPYENAFNFQRPFYRFQFGEMLYYNSYERCELSCNFKKQSKANWCEAEDRVDYEINKKEQLVTQKNPHFEIYDDVYTATELYVASTFFGRYSQDEKDIQDEWEKRSKEREITFRYINKNGVLTYDIFFIFNPFSYKSDLSSKRKIIISNVTVKNGDYYDYIFKIIENKRALNQIIPLCNDIALEKIYNWIENYHVIKNSSNDIRKKFERKIKWIDKNYKWREG